MKKKLMRTAKGLIVGGTILGVGSSVVGSAGGNPQALATFSGMMPSVASASGGGIVIGELGNLSRVSRRKRRR